VIVTKGGEKAGLERMNRHDGFLFVDRALLAIRGECASE
jgi:hypothetical protein